MDRRRLRPSPSRRVSDGPKTVKALPVAESSRAGRSEEKYLLTLKVTLVDAAADA